MADFVVVRLNPRVWTLQRGTRERKEEEKERTAGEPGHDGARVARDGRVGDPRVREPREQRDHRQPDERHHVPRAVRHCLHHVPLEEAQRTVHRHRDPLEVSLAHLVHLPEERLVPVDARVLRTDRNERVVASAVSGGARLHEWNKQLCTSHTWVQSVKLTPSLIWERSLL